jgi:hypothetical protein
MPLQNRVTPFGELIAVPERGTLLGNRGVLVDVNGRLSRRRWSTQAWIACLLRFKGRRRLLMQPGSWTELFFLDEATALAAGHRPCGECRRADYRRFKDAWLAVNRERIPDGPAGIQAIDRVLHAERIARWRGASWPEEDIAALPDGTMVMLEEGAAWLVCGQYLWRWAPSGYVLPQPRPERGPVRLITPHSIVGAIRAGYAPAMHPSAWNARGRSAAPASSVS